MFRLQRIDQLPDDFDEYVAEIADGIARLYGGRAADAYRRAARNALQATLDHASVTAWMACDGDATAGLLLATLRDRAGHISFIHVLRRHEGRGVEHRLVEESVRTLRELGAQAIVSECVAFCALDLDVTFRELGFAHIERALMEAPLSTPGLAPASASSVAVDERRYAALASIIVDAYVDHPGRELHAEVRDYDAAYDFIQRVSDGHYGESSPEYIRAAVRDGRIVGAILGCEITPGHGFVLQVAVERSHQGHGIGAALVGDLARAFADTGLTNMVLGVTCDNPARRLYERLGFKHIRPVSAYVWRRR